MKHVYEISSLDVNRVNEGGGEDDGEDDEEEELQEEDLIPVIDLDADSIEEDDEEEFPDNSSRIFDHHGSKSVFCVDVNQEGLMASGGENDEGCLWNSFTGDLLLSLNPFSDSVTQIQFNMDGSLLAVADMSGLIKVWRVSERTLLWEFEVSEVSWLSWHKSCSVLFVGTDKSEIWMWKLPRGDCKVFSGFGSSVVTALLYPDGKNILVGYNDAALRSFSLKSGAIIFETSKSENDSVSSLDIHSTLKLIAVGFISGSIKFYVGVSGKDSGSVTYEEPDNSVESLLFTETSLLSGHLNGTLCIWDISSKVQKNKVSLSSGIVKLVFRNGVNHQVLIANLDGNTLLFDTQQFSVIGKAVGHRSAILDISQSKDGNLLVSASDDGTLRTYDIPTLISSYIVSN